MFGVYWFPWVGAGYKLGFSASFCWMVEAFFEGLHTKEEDVLGNDEEWKLSFILVPGHIIKPVYPFPVANILVRVMDWSD